MFRRITVLAATVALVAGGATAAYAGAVPSTPPPTVSPNFGFHPPKVQVRDWQFDLEQSDLGPAHVNDVEGFGAIAFSGWQDTQLSPNVDRFSLGGSSVTIWHDALPVPTVELDTCTINFDQNEGMFRIIGGTGIGAGLRSVNGHFDLRGVISVRDVQRKHVKYGGKRDEAAVCPLRFASPGQLLRDVEFGRPLPGVVTFSDFAVQGDAQVFRVREIKPVPYPTPVPVTTSPATYLTPAA